MNARDVPLPVQWHEGMLLAPQHFQQFALRQELLLHYQLAMLAPFHWGIRHLRIDPILLADGTFRVTEIEAVMPDGLVVSQNQDEGSELTLDLATRVEELRQRHITVQLSVPAVRPTGTNAGGPGARYASVEGAPVVDQNTGEGELRIPRLQPQLSLVAAEEPMPRHTTLPIARVVYRDETFSLGEYVPPQLRIAPRSPIGDACAKLATRIREKAFVLAEQVMAPNVSRGAPQLLHTRLMIHGMVAELTRFEAMLASGVAHPFPLYLCLCSLVGQTAAVGSSLVPPVLEPYNHADLHTTFEQATKLVMQSLEEGIVEAYSPHTFFQREGAFTIHFAPEWKTRSLVLGVRKKSGVSEEEMDAWVATSLIGSIEKIPAIRQKRILGVARSRAELGDLVPAHGVSLYALQQDSEFIESGQELVVLNLDDPGGKFRPVEIVLYVRQ